LHFRAVPGPYVVLSVKDAGTGIPPEIINQIFDPFFTTKEPGKGTGLGLSSVLSIVKSHGGFIDVHSEVGKGSEFKVYLPAKEEEVKENVIKSNNMPMGHGETVLVVDDEKSLQDLVRATLESRRFKVMTAFDGHEAISIYEKNRNKIDVVLLDMLMPNMNGLVTIPALKRINPNVKIIGMSGSMLENLPKEMAELVKELPFLQKPFDSEDMVMLVNNEIYGAPKIITVYD
ncbi:MAG: response regulator, partial [Bacteroidetes bacterium]|nr:response regulator [Bacteroidota bacterium]